MENKKITSPFKIKENEIVYLKLDIIDLYTTYEILLIKIKENKTSILIINFNTKEHFFYSTLKTNINNIYLIFINLTRQKKMINDLECLLFEFEMIQKLLKKY